MNQLHEIVELERAKLLLVVRRAAKRDALVCLLRDHDDEVREGWNLQRVHRGGVWAGEHSKLEHGQEPETQLDKELRNLRLVWMFQLVNAFSYFCSS